jgi:hypothetical protein
MNFPNITSARGGWFGAGLASGRVTSLFGFPGVVLAFVSVLALTGCFSDERVAGGDDFPNSVETLGKQAATETSDSTEWNGYKQAPSTPPEAYDSTEVPDEAPRESTNGLGKASVLTAGNDGRVAPGLEIANAVRNIVTVNDAVTGLNRAIRVQTLLGVEARDTTWFRVQGAPPMRRMVRMSGVVAYPTGRTERFSFEDADGDSVLSPMPGSRNLARARFVVTFPGGRIEERTVIVAAGPDRVFGTKDDNATRSLDAVHRIGTDTLYHLKLRPVAGDSVVNDRVRDSVRVDVEHMVTVGGVRVVHYYRAVVKGDSLRNRATRFRRVVTTPKGITETVALGRDSLPDFAPGDTGYVRVTFTSSDAADTVALSVTTYKVAVTDSAGRHERSRMLRLDRERTLRYGPYSASRFRLWPSTPVPDGQFARIGGVELRLDVRAGGWIGFVGDATASGFSGTWFNDRGESGVVHYSALGAIVTNPSP